MADDAAAPDGELTTSRADSAKTTDKEASGAVEPESTAADVPETGKPEPAAGGRHFLCRQLHRRGNS